LTTTANAYQEHGRTGRGEEKGFLPDFEATLAANHAAFLCLITGNCCGCFFRSAPKLRHFLFQA